MCAYFGSREFETDRFWHFRIIYLRKIHEVRLGRRVVEFWGARKLRKVLRKPFMTQWNCGDHQNSPFLWPLPLRNFYSKKFPKKKPKLKKVSLWRSLTKYQTVLASMEWAPWGASKTSVKNKMLRIATSLLPNPQICEPIPQNMN